MAKTKKKRKISSHMNDMLIGPGNNDYGRKKTQNEIDPMKVIYGPPPTNWEEITNLMKIPPKPMKKELLQDSPTDKNPIKSDPNLKTNSPVQYHNTQTISRELLSNTPLTDSDLFRESICKMIYDIPLEDLMVLFKLEKIDPNSFESRSKFLNKDTPSYIREKLKILALQDVIEYNVSVSIK